MPTYEYECKACGKVHEVFHGMNDPHLRKCPSCGKLKLKKLVSAGAGVLFKGSGFYTTDYRSKEYKDKAKKEKSESKGESKSESKGDGKSEKKTEAKSDSGSKGGASSE